MWRAAQILTLPANRVSLNDRLDGAERQLNLALSADPENADAKVLMAQRVLVPRRKFDEALNIFLELFDKYPVYYVQIGELLTVLERTAEIPVYLNEAISAYDELLIEEPRNTAYLRRRANAYIILKQYDRAIESLQNAIADAETDVARKELELALSNTYIGRANPHRSETHTAEGRKNFLDNIALAYQVNPENEVAMFELTRYALAGFEDSDAARRIYNPLDNIDGAPDTALQVLGTREMVRPGGDKVLGLKLLTLAIQKNPRNHEALNNLAYILMESDLNRAFELANTAVTLQPRNFQYRDTRGNIYMRLEQYPKAINDLEIALGGMKEKIAVYDSLIRCYEKQGMLRVAKSYREKADELRAARQSTTPENDPPANDQQ